LDIGNQFLTRIRHGGIGKGFKRNKVEKRSRKDINASSRIQGRGTQIMFLNGNRVGKGAFKK
jgi:hypothetical protein